MDCSWVPVDAMARRLRELSVKKANLRSLGERHGDSFDVREPIHRIEAARSSCCCLMKSLRISTLKASAKQSRFTQFFSAEISAEASASNEKSHRRLFLVYYRSRSLMEEESDQRRWEDAIVVRGDLVWQRPFAAFCTGQFALAPRFSTSSVILRWSAPRRSRSRVIALKPGACCQCERLAPRRW